MSDGLLGIDLPRCPSKSRPVGAERRARSVSEVYRAGARRLAVVRTSTPVRTRRRLHESLLGTQLDVIAACVGGPSVDVPIRVFGAALGLAEDSVTAVPWVPVAPWWVQRAGAPTVGRPSGVGPRRCDVRRLFEENVEVAGMARTFFGGDLRA